jgi:S-formylglutathione hydrolase FrmB
MGGGGSTSYAERHSDLFGACYAMSALMELPQYTPEQERNTDLESMEGQLYVSVRNLGCTKFLREASDEVKKQLRTVQWFVDCGDDDFLLDRNLEFYQAMREARIPCQLRVRDGGHTWEYWHSALYTCLPFVTRVFK